MRKRMQIPEIFDRPELKRFFLTIDHPRILMAATLGYFLGLRISEVCKLRKMDFELDRDRPFVKIIDSKFGKSRNVPIIVAELIPIFKKYFDAIPSQYLMWSKKKDGNICKTTLSEQFNQYLDKAGLLIPGITDKRGRVRFKYHFHTLRHTIATHMIEKGYNESYVQKFLGHSDVSTVQVYTHISNPVLYDKLSTMFSTKEEKKPRRNDGSSPPMIELEKMKLEIERLKLENERMKLTKEASASVQA